MRLLRRLWRAIRFPHETNLVASSQLFIKVTRHNKARLFSRRWFQEQRNLLLRGDKSNYGCVSRKCVTTNGVRWLTDLIAGDTNPITSDVPSPANLCAHAWGTGDTAESVGDTALASSVEPTNYPPNPLVDGTHVSATVGDNSTFTSVATITSDFDDVAITEHGIFDAHEYTESGYDDTFLVLFDRTVFSPINLNQNDTITFTYILTLSSGG